MANLRGGGEYGEAWHDAGHARAQAERVRRLRRGGRVPGQARSTRKPDALAIRGGTNGGLLVGAAMTQRPELFGAVVCAVPLLDMVRYHLFGSGKTWVPEYGSAEDAERVQDALRLLALPPREGRARTTRRC